MHRALMIFAVSLLALDSTGCPHEAFHMSISNGTHDSVYVEIHFDGSALPLGHGYIEAGNSLYLTEMIEHISYLDYKSSDHTCRMDKVLLVKAARVATGNVCSVTLDHCRQGDAT